MAPRTALPRTLALSALGPRAAQARQRRQAAQPAEPAVRESKDERGVSRVASGAVDGGVARMRRRSKRTVQLIGLGVPPQKTMRLLVLAMRLPVSRIVSRIVMRRGSRRSESMESLESTDQSSLLISHL